MNREKIINLGRNYGGTKEEDIEADVSPKRATEGRRPQRPHKKSPLSSAGLTKVLGRLRKCEAAIHASLLPQDGARLEYGRILWKNPGARARLIKHWTDPRHPHHQRFEENRERVETLLQSSPAEDDTLDEKLRREGLSLRVLAREIPPVFGSFWGTKTPDSRALKLGQQIRIWRKAERLTQKKLAVLSGVPLTAIRRCEQKGEIPLVRYLQIAATLSGELIPKRQAPRS